MRWVLMTYRLPREPSTPRIALWRRLRRLGALQILDGLVALPLDAQTREQLEWLADGVIEAGGEASVLLAEPTSIADERRLAERMAASVAKEYVQVEAAAERAAETKAGRVQAVRLLRRRLRDIRRRDHFPPPERARAEQAVERLAVAAGSVV
ncbi:Chromate resistance protein ChrB [Miltoncostaea oceani]|uniref:Chromate resistance protein ChrB n=1 Tax=Miltoncostaea oceani TaxID=2843216 RepID=UPI001FE8A72B|nr:Chromate resistance protein ChrB [Miltoncostaea oceani]